MATNLQSALEQLTAFSDTDQPFFSIYVDWEVDGNGQRAASRMIEDELNRIIAERNPHGDNRANLEADRDRVLAYLEREAPPEARGLAIFACASENAWMPLALHVPVETRVVADRFPHVFQLARIVDDYETCALVLAEGQEARIAVIAYNEAEFIGQTEASEKIKRFDAGGAAQMLFQRRTDNVIKAHMKDLGAELGRVIKRYDVQHIIVAGNDSIKGIVLDTLPDQIKSRMVDYINLDPNSTMKTIMEKIGPMLDAVERQQEQVAVAELENQAGAASLGVVGTAETAMALSKGQVRALMLLQDFNGQGGICPNCGMLRAGTRTKCPYDGTDMNPVDLREAFVARAMQQGAAVQVVSESAYLGEHEGVGALLRYRDDSQERVV